MSPGRGSSSYLIISHAQFIDVIQAIIPEVLNAVGLLGINLSMERLCFENGAIIVPSLNIQHSGVNLETVSDVPGSRENNCAVSIKTEDDDMLSLGTASSSIRLDNLEFSCRGIYTNDIKEKIKELNEKNPINQRTHQCKLCPKNFCQKEHLCQHVENVHMTHQCEFCAKKFSRREPLCQHLKAAHDGETQASPFRCELCLVTFGKKKVFERHIQIFHPTELHECKDCQKRFNGKGHLAEHVKAAHPKEKRHVCKLCLTTFFSRSALKAHKKKKHGQSTF